MTENFPRYDKNLPNANKLRIVIILENQMFSGFTPGLIYPAFRTGNIDYLPGATCALYMSSFLRNSFPCVPSSGYIFPTPMFTFPVCISPPRIYFCVVSFLVANVYVPWWLLFFRVYVVQQILHVYGLDDLLDSPFARLAYPSCSTPYRVNGPLSRHSTEFLNHKTCFLLPFGTHTCYQKYNLRNSRLF